MSELTKLNQPELTTEVEFTLECEEQTGTAIGLNAAGFDLILVGSLITVQMQDILIMVNTHEFAPLAGLHYHCLLVSVMKRYSGDEMKQMNHISL
jgi:hypothetical protein